MKIHLAFAAVGGWSIASLSRQIARPLNLLISYHYDKRTLATYEKELNERLFLQRGNTGSKRS